MTVVFTLNPPRRTGPPSPVQDALPGAPPAGDPYHEQLRLAYVRRITVYHAEREGLRRGGSAAAQCGLRADEFPTLTVPAPVDEQVVLSPALFPQLFDLYLLHGWPAVTAAEAAFPNSALPVTGDLPGGTAEPTVWTVARSFFAFTRDLLGMAVRHELIALEDLAASYTARGLAYSKEQLTNAITALDVIETEIPATKTAGPGGMMPIPVGPGVYYRFGKDELGATVYKELMAYIAWRDEYEAAVGYLDWLGEAIMTNTSQAFSRPGPVHLYPDQETTALYAEQATTRADVALLADRVAKAKADLEKTCPLAFLVTGTLAATDNYRQMETQLGRILWTLKRSADGLTATAISGKLPSALPACEPRDSEPVRRARLGISAPGHKADDKAPARPLDDDTSWQPYLASGPEWTLIDTAAQRLDDDAGWLPLVHEQVWHKLLTGSEIPRQSFTYFVAFHYRVALIRHQAQAATNRQLWDVFWAALEKAGAVLSLAALAGPLAPTVAAVGVLTSVALTAHSVKSVLDQMTALDTSLATALASGRSTLATDAQANVGAVALLRAEFLEDAAQQFLLDAVLQHAGELPKLKVLVLMYGHYQDVRTLLEPFDDAEETPGDEDFDEDEETSGE